MHILNNEADIFLFYVCTSLRSLFDVNDASEIRERSNSEYPAL